uniref:Uncharacterized protein n=1 Tax=Leersia perrieri TaxID=77586 RepID=A0A0D9X4G9_9ORYZ
MTSQHADLPPTDPPPPEPKPASPPTHHPPAILRLTGANAFEAEKAKKKEKKSNLFAVGVGGGLAEPGELGLEGGGSAAEGLLLRPRTREEPRRREMASHSLINVWTVTDAKDTRQCVC